MPSLVLLDLDGTLVDDSRLPQAMRTTCERLVADLPGVTADDLVAANTAVWQRLWPEVEDDYMLGGRDGTAVSDEAWCRTLEACGVRDADAVDRAVRTWTAEEHASWRLYPDALPALDGLAAEGVRLGMVTNGSSAVQRDKLRVLGIEDRFDPLIVSSEAGFRKPDPAIFEVALAAAGLPAAHTWFVGDNLWHDVPGAVETGVRAIWLDRDGVTRQPGWPAPDATIRSLTDLLGALQQD